MDDEQFDRELLKQDARERNGQWRFSREVSVTNVLSLFALVAAGFGAYYGLDKRVASTEQSIVTQKQTDDRQDAEAQRTNVQVQAALDRINTKLDRLIERRP